MKITTYETRIKQETQEIEDLRRMLQSRNDASLAQY